jgi:hypothetical protein
MDQGQMDERGVYATGCFGFPATVEETTPERAMDAGYAPGCFGFPAHVEGVPGVLPRNTGASCLRSEWPKPWVVVNTETHQRLCSICEEWKDISEFYPERSSALGRGGYCKTCKLAYNRHGLKAA